MGEDRIRPSVYPPAQPFAPQLRLPQRRKINCTLHSPKNLCGGLRCSQLKVRLRRKACHAPQTASAAPQNQLHLANALAEKAAWWVAMCHAGLYLKVC